MLYSAGIGSFLGCLILEFCSKYHTLNFLMIEPVLIITIKAAYGVSVKKAGTYSLYAWILAFVSGGIFKTALFIAVDYMCIIHYVFPKKSV